MSFDERAKTRWLETITNICIVSACVVVTAAIVQRWFFPKSRTGPLAPAYETGERVTPPSGVRFGTHSRTVLLYLSSRCHFCTASMPFYRKLGSARRSADFDIVVLGGEPEESLAAYVRQHNLDVGRVVSVSRDAFRANATPSLVIVDRAGTVEGAWTGLLGAREEEVRRRLGLAD